MRHLIIDLKYFDMANYSFEELEMIFMKLLTKLSSLKCKY